MSAPTACVEEIQDMPAPYFWAALKDFGGWDKWFPLFNEIRIINNKEGVGAVRKFETITGSTYEEELVELDETEFLIRYDVVSAKPALPGVASIKNSIKLDAINPKKTKITWSCWAEVPGLDPMTTKFTLGKVKQVQEQVFNAGIQSLVQTIFVKQYMQQSLGMFTDKAMTMTRALLVGRAETWEYADYPKSIGGPMPRMVKGLPASEFLAAHKVGSVTGRILENVYLQIGQMLKNIGTSKKDHSIDHKQEYLDLSEYGHGLTDQERNLAKRTAEKWEDDIEFCQQLLQGVNPIHIRMVKQIHEVPVAMLGLTITEKNGDVKSVQQLLNEKRLLILDYRELSEFQLQEGKYFYPAVMLIYREILGENESQLNALGIQLDSTTNEVFTPNMPQKNRWKFAKIFVASADIHVHEFQNHLGLAHLGMEAACVAIHNRLPKASKTKPGVKTHPIRAMLEPHTQDTIGINFTARLLLIPEKDAMTDKPFATGTKQATKMVANAWAKYDFFRNSFPEELKARGFDEEGTDGVQNYYYRDDGFKLWHLMGDYTTDAVNHIYADDEAVKSDGDLQKWADEMSARDGANIPGFPTTIPTKKLLAHVLQILIWHASAYHSILDFPQWTYVGLIPNRPNAVYMPMPPLPEDGSDIEDDYFKKCFAAKIDTLFQTTFSWLLSTPSEATLTSLAALKGIHDDVDANFQKKLAKYGEEIRERNAKLEAEGKAPYIYLLPEMVACSVDI